MDLARDLPAAPVLWGLFIRALGLSYFLAFVSLSGQIVALAGACGITPVAPLLRRIRRDFPSSIRFFFFPTLLWFGASDRLLRFHCLCGCLAAAFVVVGGPWSPLALAICWVCYLSLDLAADFERPWDTLLLEAGLLALWLPPLHILPQVSADSAPMAVIGWAYRWLFFRVMIGFGKQKFARSTLGDLDYLRGFFINQPMPTPLGYWAHRLPLGILRFAIAMTFVVELIVPFFVFLWAWPRLIAATLTAGLMIVIQSVGSYSFFNVLVLGLCITLVDGDASILQAPLPWNATPKEALAELFVLVLAIGGLLHLPFNHWCTRTFLHWPLFRGLRGSVRCLLAFYRALAPFHLVHSYGVFPPRSGPPLRIVPLIEGTRDGVNWEEYHYRFQPCTPTSRPRFVAPLHPFFDFTLPYEGLGHNLSGFLCTISGTGNPYRFARHSRFDCLLQRLLEGSPDVTALFAHVPFSPANPPVAVRARVCVLAPKTPAERARTGEWWERRFEGMHTPPMNVRSDFWDHWLPEPELFHPEDIIWTQRSPALRALWHMAEDAGPDAVVRAPGLTRDDLDRFWSDFIPSLGIPDIARVSDVREELERRFDINTLRGLERVYGRLAFLLVNKLDPHTRGHHEPHLRVRSYFHLSLFVHEIIGRGRETFERVWAEPARAQALLSEFQEESGLFYLGLFRHATLLYHASKLRLIATTWGEQMLDSPLRGFPDLYPLLQTRYGVAPPTEALRQPATVNRSTLTSK